MPSTSRSIIEDIGLVLLVMLSSDTLRALAASGLSASMLMQAFYLMAFIHLAVSLYDGRFDRLRTITWLVLILGWTTVGLASFARYVLPLGQTLFWIAANMPWAAPLLEWLMTNAEAIPIALLLVLAADVLLMQQQVWQQRSRTHLAVLIAAGAVSGLALSAVVARLAPAPTPSTGHDIVPSWHTLTFYAIARAVSDKTMGMAAFLAALAAPAVWPWMRVDRLRGGRARLTWLGIWLGFIATCLALAWLGARPPEEEVLLLTRILTLIYFASLLVAPVLLRRLTS